MLGLFEYLSLTIINTYLLLKTTKYSRGFYFVIILERSPARTHVFANKLKSTNREQRHCESLGIYSIYYIFKKSEHL